MYIPENAHAAFVPFVQLSQIRTERIGVEQADHNRELACADIRLTSSGEYAIVARSGIVVRNGFDQLVFLVGVRLSLRKALRCALALRHEDRQGRPF